MGEREDKFASMEVDSKNNPDKREATEKLLVKLATMTDELVDAHTDEATASRIKSQAAGLRSRAYQLSVVTTQ